MDANYRRLAAFSLMAEKRIFLDSICLILSATEGVFSPPSSSPCMSYSLQQQQQQQTAASISRMSFDMSCNYGSIYV